MKPYYQDKYATIFLGDCLELLPEMPKVDLLVTDIPYGEVNRDSNGLRNLNKGIADIANFDISFLANILQGCFDGSGYVWCGTEQVSFLRKCFVENDMSTRMCVWEKTNPSPMNGQHLWLSSVELCVFAKRKNAFFAYNCESPVFRLPVQTNQLHPTQKPVELMETLIKASTLSTDSVLDPFGGSCTTAVAAKQLNRKSITIEIEEKYCEIGAKRLSQEVLDLA